MKLVVPIDSLYDYLNSRWHYEFEIESQLSNYGKKSNYKKFAKKLKKAVRFLPRGLEVVVRTEGGAL